ncbi:MAG: hypothetical protein PF442_00175 [Desulfobulbaceae bacterium]|jgi:nickel transport protein|nr:hypothetical protein [Desulfobulbaceae bacterium]
MLILKKISITFCLLVAVFCLLPSISQAHKVRIFAYAEGNTIVGETAFSGGRAAKDSLIIVQDAASAKPLLTCRTDDHGQFRFQIPEEARKGQLNLRIIINTGEGHRGEWLLEAAEYLGDGEGESVSTRDQKSVAEVALASMTTKPSTTDEELIRRVVEEAMDKKLSPIKRMLAESQNKGPSLQDILGGIGYILGLAGIIAYIKSNPKG